MRWGGQAYDGTDFLGWAQQPDRRTVQGTVQEALAGLLRAHTPRLQVAGRTDAGVHARGQVAHADLPAELASDRLLLRRLNGLLSPDVRVRRVSPAPAGFDARFSALARTYRYRIADGPEAVDPPRRHDVLAWPRPLDLAAADRRRGTARGARLRGRTASDVTARPPSGELLELDWARGQDGLLVMTIAPTPPATPWCVRLSAQCWRWARAGARRRGRRVC